VGNGGREGVTFLTLTFVFVQERFFGVVKKKINNIAIYIIIMYVVRIHHARLYTYIPFGLRGAYNVCFNEFDLV